MNINSTIVAAILLASSTLSKASEVNLERVEKQVSTSTYRLIKEDPKTAPLPDEKVRAYSSMVAKQTISCFREKIRNTNQADLIAFEGAITAYDNIYSINDWGTFVRGWIEKDYGLKWKDWGCDEERPPSSPNCKAVKSYFEVSAGLYPTLLKCLTDSSANVNTLAVLK